MSAAFARKTARPHTTCSCTSPQSMRLQSLLACSVIDHSSGGRVMESTWPSFIATQVREVDDGCYCSQKGEK